jgi:hypothetical protein
LQEMCKKQIKDVLVCVAYRLTDKRLNITNDRELQIESTCLLQQFNLTKLAQKMDSVTHASTYRSKCPEEV